MADPQHLTRLKKGVANWNKWREQNPTIRPELSGAKLSFADLSNFANPSGAYLGRVGLKDANLRYANLSFADLSGVDLRNANLSFADLSAVDLKDAHLQYAGLIGVDLKDANLYRANLSGAILYGADLSVARVRETQFTALDLRSTKGLETIQHTGPSSIGIDTLYRSGGHIPESFLRQAGIPEDFLTYLPSLLNRAIEYYSCFISYSSKDQKFVERLYADLQSKGVRCWFAPEDLKTGDKIRDRIDESIRLYDKLLLVLSGQSVASAWVEYEVEAALAKERRENRTVLFPIRVDDAVMESPTAWASHIQDTRHIGNFTHWKEYDSYQWGLQRLLRDLHPDKPPESTKP